MTKSRWSWIERRVGVLALGSLLGGVLLLLSEIWLPTLGGRKTDDLLMGRSGLLFFLGLLAGVVLLYRRLSLPKQRLPTWIGVALVLALVFVVYTLWLIRISHRLQGEISQRSELVDRLHTLVNTLNGLEATLPQAGRPFSRPQWQGHQETWGSQLKALGPEDPACLAIQSFLVEAAMAVMHMDQYLNHFAHAHAGPADLELGREMSLAQGRYAREQIQEAVRVVQEDQAALLRTLANRRLWIQSLLLASGVLLVGAVLLVGSYHRRLADQQRVEQELRRGLQFSIEAEALAQLGSFVWDVAHNRLTGSEGFYRIHGVPPPDFGTTLESLLECVHPDDRERVQSAIEFASREGGVFRLEQRILRPDGTVRVLDSRGRVEVDAAGQPVRIMGTCLDITEQPNPQDVSGGSEQE